nr:SMR family transporter [Polaromonas sp. CG_9.11]
MPRALPLFAEVIATTVLKASDSFTRGLPSALAVSGDAIAFYFLSITQRSMPTGIACAIWSGLGMVLITIASFMVYRQTIDLPGLLGMGLMIASVVVLNVLSKSAAQ